MLPRIRVHRVRAQYLPAAILEQPLLVFSVAREMPNVGRFQGDTSSVLVRISKIHISGIRMADPDARILEVMVC
jgi:hypothetical protein